MSMENEFIPQVVVETAAYLRAVESIWDDELRAEFVSYIGVNPTQGDIIPGTGGIRKIRYQGSGHGKRGGVRVIYYFYNEDNPVYLLYAYPKNVQVNLSEREKKALSAVATEIKQVLRGKEREK